MKAKVCKKRTIIKHLYCFRKFLKLLPKNLNLKKASKEDIEKVIAKVEVTAGPTRYEKKYQDSSKVFLQTLSRRGYLLS